MHVEIFPPEGQVQYPGQMITFMDQETTEVQHRIHCALSAFARHRQELTSESYLQGHKLHIFDAVTPTIRHGAGTWTTTQEHEKMLRASQRRMLRLIIQTKKSKRKTMKTQVEKTCKVSEDTREEDNTKDEYDQDSSISFENDTESTSSQEQELEDWIE